MRMLGYVMLATGAGMALPQTVSSTPTQLLFCLGCVIGFFGFWILVEGEA
jgi:hypothetical protein